jgi:hypothetical protein
MKKQSLLLICALIGGAFMVSCNQKQAATEDESVKIDKKIYLQLYSVRDDINSDFKGTIQKVAEIGYTGIEAAGYADGKFYGLEPKEFKKEIESVGMEVLSSHAGRPLAENVAQTNWEEVWEWWDTAIAAHKAAGMKYLVVPWIPTPKTLADLKSYCDYFNQIGEKCNAAGLRFGYHNHNFEFVEIEGETMYDYMLNNTDPSKVFFQMDVNNGTFVYQNSSRSPFARGFCVLRNGRNKIIQRSRLTIAVFAQLCIGVSLVIQNLIFESRLPNGFSGNLLRKIENAAVGARRHFPFKAQFKILEFAVVNNIASILGTGFSATRSLNFNGTVFNCPSFRNILAIITAPSVKIFSVEKHNPVPFIFGSRNNRVCCFTLCTLLFAPGARS